MLKYSIRPILVPISNWVYGCFGVYTRVPIAWRSPLLFNQVTQHIKVHVRTTPVLFQSIPGSWRRAQLPTDLGRHIDSLSFLGLFHFMINDPTRLGFPRKQDGVGMHV